MGGGIRGGEAVLGGAVLGGVVLGGRLYDQSGRTSPDLTFLHFNSVVIL